jgi:AraC-like DNA-binding protein
VTESRYCEFAPAPRLLPDVACVWFGDIGDDGGYTDRVLPDACMDIIWDGQAVFVAGPDTGPQILDRPPGQHLVGFRFRPGHLPAFLRVGAHELVDRRVDLSELWSDATVRSLTDELATTGSIRALECAIATHARSVDPIVGAATHVAESANGAGVVERLAEVTAMNARTLHRRSQAAFGYGPKMLQRVLRFRRFVDRADSGPVALAQVATELGYADQSHLTRECVELSGLPPAALLRARVRA